MHVLDSDDSRGTADFGGSRQTNRFGEESAFTWRGSDAVVGADTGCQTTGTAPTSLVDQQRYFGRIIMQVQELSRKAISLRKNIDADRASLADIVHLEHGATQMESKAKELEKAAKEARAAADQAAHNLQQERQKENGIKEKKEESRQVSKDLAESRAKLNTD